MTIKVCKKCNKKKEIFAKELCRSCYMAERNKKIDWKKVYDEPSTTTQGGQTK